MATKEKTTGTKLDVGAEAPGNSGVDLIKIARILVDHRWVVLLAVLASIAFTVLLSFVSPPTFRSTATIDVAPAGIVFIGGHKTELLWDTERPVLDVAERSGIDLSNVNWKANIRHIGVTSQLGRLDIEVVANKRKVPKRLALALAEHFLDTADRITKESGERELEVEEFERSSASIAKQVKANKAQRLRLRNDIAFLESRTEKLDLALRDGLTGLVLRAEIVRARKDLYSLDGERQSILAALDALHLEELKREEAPKQFEVAIITEPLEVEETTFFNSVIAGFIGFILVIAVLYYRQTRARISTPG